MTALAPKADFLAPKADFDLRSCDVADVPFPDEGQCGEKLWARRAKAGGHTDKRGSVSAGSEVV
jgi:hypothetical protein